MLIQVGQIALRAPDGSFRPAEPIYREVPDSSPPMNEITAEELTQLFYDRMSEYIKARNRRKKYD